MSSAKIIGLIALGAVTALTLVYLPSASVGWMVALVLLANTPNEQAKR